MATTLKIVESAPASYPPVSGLPEGVTAASVWQRIESYIGWRFGSRAVVFTVEGPGDWSPPLQPATLGATEIWRDDAWAAVTLSPTPLAGRLLPECAHYRIAATVGAGDPPAAVAEAARRLAGYLCAAEDMTHHGAFVRQEDITSLMSIEYAPAGGWPRALQYSGAADLLRPFRNLGAA